MAQNAFLGHGRTGFSDSSRHGRGQLVEAAREKPLTSNPPSRQPSPDRVKDTAPEPRAGRRLDTFMDRLTRRRRGEH